MASVAHNLRAALRGLRAGVPWLPYVARNGRYRWAIGIYHGSDPLRLDPHPAAGGPVLTAADVRDVAAEFVADPFLVHEGGRYWMFFEAMTYRQRRGQIGLAASDDGVHWTYRQIVLREPFHLSYPNVFCWEGEHYMVPESRTARSVRLYRAAPFPTTWSCVATLVQGEYGDPTVFHRDGTWWLFASPADDQLKLFYADRLHGPWREHPQSPVVRGDPHRARPAGRVVPIGARWVRFAQDTVPAYGTAVRAMEIVTLTRSEYEERPLSATPVLKPSGAGWNAAGMHHLDVHCFAPDRYVACVDGWCPAQPSVVLGWGR